MRALLFTFFITCLVCFLVSCKKNKLNVCEYGLCTIAKPIDTYNYPVTGGTPQWAAFTTHQQMLDACQIPVDTLAKMSTEGLIQTCLNFPLLGDLLLNVGGNVPGRLQYFMINFSGLNELCKRPDAGIKMINRYLIMYPSCIDSCKSNTEKGRFTSEFTAYEMIISYESIIKKMSLENKKYLIKEALNKYNCKKHQSNNYAYYDFATSLYIPAKIMMQENYAPFVQQALTNAQLKLYINKLLWPPSAKETDIIFDIIIQNATVFIK